MSETLLIAIITATPTVLVTFGVLGIVIYLIRDLRDHINSRMDEFIALTARESRAAGVSEEQARQREREREREL
jgi:hypothetical protein